MCECKWHMNKQGYRSPSQEPAFLFVIDPQTDCHCDIERYDADKSTEVVVVGEDIRFELADPNTCRVNLPMIDNPIKRETIIEALILATRKAETIDLAGLSLFKSCILKLFKYDDLIFTKVISSPRTPYKQHMKKPDGLYFNYEQITYQEWPDNLHAFLPDPEFLGCFTFNISKHGLFFLPASIRKLEL